MTPSDIKTIGDVAGFLEKRQKDIKTRAVSLNDFQVIQHDKFQVGDLELYVEDYGSSSAGTKLDQLPIKQLCSAIGMSSTFYLDNPADLNTTIFNERLRSLDDAGRIIRWRETERGNQLLAILPLAHQAPNYADVVAPLVNALPSNHVLRLENSSEVDYAHRFSMRISLLDFPISVKERDGKQDPAELGLFIDMSEDGRPGKMALTNMVYNQTCTNGAMVTYDRHPYFEYNYRGIKAVDLGHALKSAINRFGDDLTFIHNRIVSSDKKQFSKGEVLSFVRNLENRRDVSIGFLRKIRKELDGQTFESMTHYRVVNTITRAAQRLPYDGRVRHEYVAGQVLGLDLRAA